MAIVFALIDVDNFDEIRDQYGQIAADSMLSKISDLLRHRLRTEDLRGRMPGEELILAFRSESFEAITQMIRRVIEELSSIEFSAGKGNSFFKVSLSGGLAQCPKDGEAIHEVLTVANRRLLEARAAGPQNFVSTG